MKLQPWTTASSFGRASQKRRRSGLVIPTRRRRSPTGEVLAVGRVGVPRARRARPLDVAVATRSSTRSMAVQRSPRRRGATDPLERDVLAR